MRDRYKERVHMEQMRMLNEILSANQPKDKRAVITRFNPYFYLLFQDGVKRYEQDDQTAEVAIRPDTGRDVVENPQERSH